MSKLTLQNSFINTIPEAIISKKSIRVDVLRLDVLHPVVSGNKWFKLKKYLAEAKKLTKKVVVTFGGAFSNHIIATAAAANYYGVKSIGIIRGEEGRTPSPTLQQAAHFGMKLFYISREDYALKKLPAPFFEHYCRDDSYLINAGGYGVPGAVGATSILSECQSGNYTHICAAVGTGTTLAGLINGVQPHQKVIGINVLKNNFSIEAEIAALLSACNRNYCIHYDYHFGGYAKYTGELIQFMNTWYQQTGIPSDFVYTGKLFYAMHHLIYNDYFPAGSNVLIIHSGGLQGNASLPGGTLIF